MGPQSARSYPGRRVVKPAGPKAQRAKQEIDYGRRGKGYVFGAFRPATGDAFTETYDGRTTTNWVDFLGAVERWIDAGVERVYAVMDNLNVHSGIRCLATASSPPTSASCCSFVGADLPASGVLAAARAAVIALKSTSARVRGPA